MTSLLVSELVQCFALLSLILESITLNFLVFSDKNTLKYACVSFSPLISNTNQPLSIIPSSIDRSDMSSSVDNFSYVLDWTLGADDYYNINNPGGQKDEQAAKAFEAGPMCVICIKSKALYCIH